MDQDGAVGRRYWREILDAAGCTRLPRPVRVVDTPRAAAAAAAAAAESRVPIPERVLAGLSEPLLLAAHAKVVAALTGDGETVTGWLPTAPAPTAPAPAASAPTASGPQAEPLPVRITVADGSWQQLAAAAGNAREQVLRHAAAAPTAAIRDRVRTDGLFESVLSRAEGLPPAGALPEGVLLWIAVDGAELVLRYRPDALDGPAVDRIAGYCLRALGHAVTGPNRGHHTRSLLSEAELHYQLHELAGPVRELPERPFHQLFEEQARLRPDAVAAVQGGRSWTYAELNRRANQVAWALCQDGPQHEQPVAVVAERSLEWLAAVVGVFKAGAVYLPVEPHFPAARIASMLRRSGCSQALTGTGTAPGLAPALAELGPEQEVTVRQLTSLLAGDGRQDDPGIPVGPDQSAYIYFTSGSTGEPKGAVCEHAGFLNHLLAKIEDLGVTEGTVVAQTAPQCFDISLWQLVAALLVGGSTLIVEQEAVADIARFVETVRAGRVGVVQLVPSYLEVLLTYLDGDPARLPGLRCVSTTGEVLKRELAQRWFAAFPGVRLVNAYGLTETSDDTNHEVLTAVPASGGIPLGRPVRNVRAYVVDAWLRPVPLGAPGEIVFSGVCVGRGYVNDPERTRAAYCADPHRPGERLYRTGDFGRWSAEGKLEFHGRRDAQLKIRGFRIEIGEIEDRLLRAPGVRDGAVVTAGAGEGRHLVGFFSGPADPEQVRGVLDASLPAYMVPTRLVRRESLPLTANGKTDKKALTRLAEAELCALPAADAEGSAAELRLAAHWAEALKTPVDRIGRRSHFFELGGTSLSAIRLAILLDRAVSVKDITRTPVLADLAALLEQRSGGGADATAPAAAVG
ncbi:amino acid adenylation domain-containing protein [Streptacidiphilus sp. PB12-B1b]|nr:amino acid adenylation domain-containing protein [Streptacidiphilus sp. PB12-B1b]